MAEKKKHSLQRTVYRKTHSAVRRWRAAPLRKPAPRKLKILTNVQSGSVAGIARVMSSFAGQVTASSHVSIDLVCVSVASPGAQRRGGTWRKEKTSREGTTMLVYEGLLPQFNDVLQSARTVNDIQSAHRVLVEAYATQIKQEKPDLVLVNGTYVVAWALMTAARRLRVPVIVYYHGSLSKETEHWTDKNHWRLMWQLELSFDRADLRYVFPSTLIKHYVERQVFKHRLRTHQTLVIPNPVPAEFFNAPQPKEKRGVGFVGRWTRIKNTAFVQKFVTVNRYHLRPLKVVVVTDQAGRAKASKVLHDYVKFAGPFRAPADMARFYAGKKAVLCPSHFETYGNVAQEAVAAGTPALVSKQMGVAEVFKKVGLGKLVVSFTKPDEIFKLLHDEKFLHINNSARHALRELVGEEVVHKKLLEFIVKSV